MKTFANPERDRAQEAVPRNRMGNAGLVISLDASAVCCADGSVQFDCSRRERSCRQVAVRRNQSLHVGLAAVNDAIGLTRCLCCADPLKRSQAGRCPATQSPRVGAPFSSRRGWGWTACFRGRAATGPEVNALLDWVCERGGGSLHGKPGPYGEGMSPIRLRLGRR